VPSAHPHTPTTGLLCIAASVLSVSCVRCIRSDLAESIKNLSVMPATRIKLNLQERPVLRAHTSVLRRLRSCIMGRKSLHLVVDLRRATAYIVCTAAASKVV